VTVDVAAIGESSELVWRAARVIRIALDEARQIRECLGFETERNAMDHEADIRRELMKQIALYGYGRIWRKVAGSKLWIVVGYQPGTTGADLTVGVHVDPNGLRARVREAGASLLEGWSAGTTEGIAVEARYADREHDVRPAVAWIVDRLRELDRRGFLEPGHAE
jgi:hypothetical protein